MEPTKAKVIQPIAADHRALLPGIEQLRATADRVGDVPPTTLARLVDACYGFLEEQLLPHASAEDEVLYVAIDRALGAPGATLTMSRDHREVAALTRQLGDLRFAVEATPPPSVLTGLRRVLYGLYAILTLHFAKEDEVYFPVLESSLTPDRAAALHEAMTGSEDRHRVLRSETGSAKGS